MPVFLCVAKTGQLLDNRIPIRQTLPLCDCDEHKRVQRYATTCRKAESEKYNGPPVKTTHEKIIMNQIIPYQPILSPEPPWYRNERSNCPAEQGCLDRLGLAGTMALARYPQLLNPLRTLAAAARPARTRLSRSVACDAKQLW